ncbi:hypothetical protein V8D89_002939 [Ganoderma adspersum]
MHPVYPKAGLSIRGFHLFANQLARAPRVRALPIDLRWRGPAQVQGEDCSLPLHILDSSSLRPIIVDPSFLNAMTAIPSLKSFDEIYPASEDSIPRSVTHTLEKLELDRFVVDPLDVPARANLLVPPASSMAPYPAVRSLTVGNFRGKPLLDHLHHLFPALDGILHVGALHLWSLGDVYVETRAANQRLQDSDGGGSPSRPWKKLDRVVCEAPILYILGMRCPIGPAMIHCGTVENYRYAALALRENSAAPPTWHGREAVIS